MKNLRAPALLFVLVGLTSLVGCSKGMHIESLKPSGGVMSGNETVAINGSGFKPEMGVTVYFGTERCPTAFVEGRSKIVVTTPPYSKSTLVDVRVITDDGEEVILRKSFKYLHTAKWSPLDGFGAKGKK